MFKLKHSDVIDKIFNSLSYDDFTFIEFSDLDPNQLLIKDKKGKNHLIEVREGKFE